MRSKKTLSIILIVGLIIFIITLAIGRPLWQAALLSVIFLLIAAAVSTAGLLIPGMLFGMSSSSSLPAATDKAEFLEKMDLMLADLSAQPKAETEDVLWMTEYTRVIKGVGELVYDVHSSVLSKNKAEESRAFREVVKQLPHLISEFENIPEPTTRKRQKIMKRQARGMNLYLLACSNFAEALKASDGELAGLAARQINDALDLLAIIDKSTTILGRK